MKYSYERLAGSIILFGVVQFLLSLQVAQDLYPNYSTSQNYISDLGATCTQSGCRIVQPTATIFNGSIIILGLTILVGTYLIYRAYKARVFSAFLFLAGIGATGVGLLPETTGVDHTIVSAITFIFAGLAALAAYRIERTPLNIYSLVLGALTLLSLVLYKSEYYLGLGAGGMERMIVYPALLWGIALSGQLITSTHDSKMTSPAAPA